MLMYMPLPAARARRRTSSAARGNPSTLSVPTTTPTYQELDHDCISA